MFGWHYQVKRRLFRNEQPPSTRWERIVTGTGGSGAAKYHLRGGQILSYTRFLLCSSTRLMRATNHSAWSHAIPGLFVSMKGGQKGCDVKRPHASKVAGGRLRMDKSRHGSMQELSLYRAHRQEAAREERKRRIKSYVVDTWTVLGTEKGAAAGLDRWKLGQGWARSP